MFDNLFANPPKNLAEQREIARRRYAHDTSTPAGPDGELVVHGQSHDDRSHQPRARVGDDPRPVRRRARRGHRNQRRRLPGDGGTAGAVRQGSRAGHAARRRHDRRHVHRHGDAGPAAGRRNPVHGLHLPGDGPDRQPHGAPAQPHPRPPDLPRRVAHAARRRHSRAGASLREPGSDARASRRTASCVSLLACARLRPVAGGDPRSRPGDLPRARCACIGW